MEAKLAKYREAFNEQFPLMLTQGMDDEDIEAAIDACLKANRPYEMNLEDGIKY